MYVVSYVLTDFFFITLLEWLIDNEELYKTGLSLIKNGGMEVQVYYKAIHFCIFSIFDHFQI